MKTSTFLNEARNKSNSLLNTLGTPRMPRALLYRLPPADPNERREVVRLGKLELTSPRKSRSAAPSLWDGAAGSTSCDPSRRYLSFRCRKQKLRAHSARWSHCTRRPSTPQCFFASFHNASRDLLMTHDLRFLMVGKEAFQAPQVLPLTIMFFFQLLHHPTRLSPSLELESLRRGLRSISDSAERSVNLRSLIVHSGVSHICQLSSSELSSSAFMHVTHTLPSFLHL